MKKVIYSIYAVISYLIIFASFLYLIGFVENLVVPKSISDLSDTVVLPAILINLSLILLFGLQHSIMARKSFKEKWTKIIPKPIERSTYLLFSAISLIILFWLWEPITYSIWDLRGTTVGYVLYGLSFLGWGILLITTFLINHFELFGLQQVYYYVMDEERNAFEFKKPAFYKYVRHPLYFGFILAFWATPYMTVGHLLFVAGMTSYILVGISYEEKDLVSNFGEKYLEYRNSTSKLFPFTK